MKNQPKLLLRFQYGPVLRQYAALASSSYTQITDPELSVIVYGWNPIGLSKLIQSECQSTTEKVSYVPEWLLPDQAHTVLDGQLVPGEVGAGVGGESASTVGAITADMTAAGISIATRL